MRHIFMHGSAALAMVLAGCGGQAETASASSGDQRIEACGLATSSEVATILGAQSVDTSGRFNEHTYTSPTTYSASCTWVAEQGAVIAVIHYPVRSPVPSAAELASQLTDFIRSQDESDPSLAELYRTLEATPVSDLPAPAAGFSSTRLSPRASTMSSACPVKATWRRWMRSTTLPSRSRSAARRAARR